MAIVKMNKFTLLTFESHRAEILKELQGFADVEFFNLQDENFLENNEEFLGLYKDSSSSEYAGCEDKLSKAKYTLQFLNQYVPRKSGLKAMKEGKRSFTLSELEEKVKNSNWEKICEKISEKEKNLAALENKITRLQNEIDLMKPWENLDVSFKELKSIKTAYFLGSLSVKYEETIISEFENEYLEIISKNNQDLYFLLIFDKDKKEEIAEKLRGFGFSEFKTDLEDTAINIIHNNADSIEKLKSKEFFVKEELASFEEDVRSLELVCEYYGNMTIRKDSINNFLKTENVLVIQGWVPEESKESLTSLVNKVTEDYNYLIFEDVKEEEIPVVPVKLKNNEINSAFEDITEMYSTPRYDEIDPTPFVTPFYLLFFGMMVADIGYGLLLLIGTLVVLKKFNLDEGTRKFMKFFFYLSFPIIGFGAIYGSFFGDLIPLPKLVDTSNDINTVLIASVGFGVVQIFFGLGIKAYMLIRDGKPKDAFYDVGAWVISLVSLGIVLGGSAIGLPSIATKIAVGTMIFGMVVIVLTGGRAEKTKAAQLGQGAYSLYGITGYVGDLVSYTRLMALGLAGGSLAGAMNQMMGMLPEGIIAIIFAPVIFIFGQLFNFALSLLGAYVHTCRLQYVEYFGKFYEGGGKAFTPFKTQNKYINLKKD